MVDSFQTGYCKGTRIQEESSKPGLGLVLPTPSRAGTQGHRRLRFP